MSIMWRGPLLAPSWLSLLFTTAGVYGGLACYRLSHSWVKGQQMGRARVDKLHPASFGSWCECKAEREPETQIKTEYNLAHSRGEN